MCLSFERSMRLVLIWLKVTERVEHERHTVDTEEAHRGEEHIPR